MMEIERVIPLQRVDSSFGTFLLLLYFPFGLLLMIFRVFLSINYLCAQLVFNLLLPPENLFRRGFERLFLAVLGVAIVHHNQKLIDRKSLFVSNQLSNVDGYFISTLCNCFVVSKQRLNKAVMQVLKQRHLPANITSQLIHSMANKNESLLLLPEACPTSGAALLKFSSWPLGRDVQVQPVAVRLRRPLPLSGSTLDSAWWQDLLWMYFSIISIYDVTFLPCIRSGDEESNSDFSERVRKSITIQLGVPGSKFDESDVKELSKRRRFESRKPQGHVTWTGNSPSTRNMARQVKDILPHVPLHVIIKDIEKTGSVDVTVTNILEGVVKFIPEPESEQQSQPKPRSCTTTDGTSRFSKSPVERHLTLQERKDIFIETAKRNYLRKRGLL